MSVNSPLKNYDFALEIAGVIQAHLQGVTPPSVEYAEHKQGNQGNRPDKKTPGKKIVGDLVIEKVVPAIEGDPEIWNWFASAQINLRPGYTRIGFLIELNSGVPVARYFLDEIWIKKIETAVHDTRGDNSADILRTVTISVDNYLKVP